MSIYENITRYTSHYCNPCGEYKAECPECFTPVCVTCMDECPGCHAEVF